MELNTKIEAAGIGSGNTVQTTLVRILGMKEAVAITVGTVV